MKQSILDQLESAGLTLDDAEDFLAETLVSEMEAEYRREHPTEDTTANHEETPKC